METNKTLDNHSHTVRTAQRLVGTCPVCKVYPTIKYEPGSTYAECKCRDWRIPEEDRIGLARKINETFIKMRK